MNEDIVKNTVSAKGQTSYPCVMEYGDENSLRVLFMGNSITLHEPSHGIGWYGNHGMAASSPERDYVHTVIRAIEEKHGRISTCVANVACFERDYASDKALLSFPEAKELKPDVVIFRFGENTNRDILASHSLEESLKRFFNYYAEGAKKVIVTDLFWYHEWICTALKNAADALGFTFVSINDLGEADENKAIGLFEHEGIALHPGDLGMKRIAERIIEALDL